MSDLKICRICLRTECKVYKYDRYHLKSYYEEVLAVKVKDTDGLPHYFCYECATMLHKFHKFKEKCYVGQQLLREISWRDSMTYEAVSKVDRKAKNLISPIQIMTTNKKRVKTYNDTASSDVSDDDSKSASDTEIDFEIVDTYLSDDCTVEDSCISPGTDPVDENKIDDSSNVNKPEIVVEDFKTELELPATELKPTETVFVTENTANTLKKELGKEKKAKAAEGRPMVTRKVKVSGSKPKFANKAKVSESKPKLAKKTKVHESEPKLAKNTKVSECEPKFVKKGKIVKKWNLDMTNWKKSSLTEEEAIERFRKRAEHPTYLKAPYKCALCITGFSREEMIKRHQVKHDESKGAVECRFCKMRFKWDCQLRKHMRAHYHNYECLRCGLVCIRETAAMYHEESHSDKIKKCAHCGEEFKRTTTYYTHLRTHRSKHLCTLCGESFVSPMGLLMHKRIKHVGVIDSLDEKVSTFCEKCDINFESRKAYEEHLFHSAMHTDVVVDEVEDPDLANVPRKVLGKKLQAQITDELKAHFTKTDGANVEKKRFRRVVRRLHRKPTTCHQCGKHFNTQSACRRHHLAEHPRTSFYSPSERHICEVCGVSVPPGSAAAHKRSHNNSHEKSHPCDTCGRYFNSSAGLKRHMVSHTGGEKPFACTLCDKRFRQSYRLKQHYGTYHKV